MGEELTKKIKQKLAKKLGKLGLRKFIQTHAYELCQKTLLANQVAVCLKLSSDIVAEIMAPPDNFSRNYKLYSVITAQSSAKKLINALDKTGPSNEHVLKYLKTKVHKAKLEPANNNNHPSSNLGLRPDISMDQSADEDDKRRLTELLGELGYLLENSHNRLKFGVKLRSQRTVTSRQKADSKVTDKRKEWFVLYDAVIQQRAWGELLSALKESRNYDIIRRLKNIWQLDDATISAMETGDAEEEMETDQIETPSRKRTRGTRETKVFNKDSVNPFQDEHDLGPSCVIQEDKKSSFSYRSGAIENEWEPLTDFIPSQDTTSVYISRLNVGIGDLHYILSKCRNNLEDLKLDGVAIAPLDNSNLTTPRFPKLRSFCVQFCRNQSSNLMDRNYFRQTFFFNQHEHENQLFELWRSEKTIDFIFSGQRLFKISPINGALILTKDCYYQLLSADTFFQGVSQDSLKSFSGERLNLNLGDIPKSVENFHLKSCTVDCSPLHSFNQFLNLKKLVISIADLSDQWRFDLKSLQNLRGLKSIALERVYVQNVHLIKQTCGNHGNGHFPSLNLLVLNDCGFPNFVPNSSSVLTKVPNSGTCIIRREIDREEWHALEQQTRDFEHESGLTFQQFIKEAFQERDFVVK